MTTRTAHYDAKNADTERSDQRNERKQQRIREQLKKYESKELEDKIRQTSPDGRPANPTLRSKEMLILAAGSLLAVLAISGVTYMLWGTNEALLVLGLGAVFAVAGNPVIWAMFFRNKERAAIQTEREKLDDQISDS
ncbi:MAG: hypothetical protein JJ974_06235 [Phycisphaerales bacterium]|nr:hypothetical protein [Phycisphaerales bacterium]